MRPIATAHTRYASGAAGPERRRGGGGKPEDSAADREVHDARRETPDPEGANERTFV